MKECVSECGTDKYKLHSSRECRARCDGLAQEGFCVQRCDAMHPFVAAAADGQKQCAKTCEGGAYSVENGVRSCAASCEGLYAVDAATGLKECRTACDTQTELLWGDAECIPRDVCYKYIDENAHKCVDTCPEGAKYVATIEAASGVALSVCRDACPEGMHAVDVEGKLVCVERCPANAPFTRKGQAECVQTCDMVDSQMNCIDECASDRIRFTITVNDKNVTQCLETCPEHLIYVEGSCLRYIDCRPDDNENTVDKPYLNGQTCVTECPVYSRDGVCVNTCGEG